MTTVSQSRDKGVAQKISGWYRSTSQGRLIKPLGDVIFCIVSRWLTAGRARRALSNTTTAGRLATVGVQVPWARPLPRPEYNQDLDKLQWPGTLQAADGLRVPTVGSLERRRQYLYTALSTQRPGSNTSILFTPAAYGNIITGGPRHLTLSPRRSRGQSSPEKCLTDKWRFAIYRGYE